MTLQRLLLWLDNTTLFAAGLLLTGFIINALVDWLGLDKYLGINR